MNGLLDRYTDRGADKQVFEKDMLFATLDTSVRQISLKDNRKFLLSDTVGFVSKLPHNLIDSFKATLAEAANADLLIQVVDYHDEHYPEMMKVTSDTLKSIGIENIPMIEAYNKADLRPGTRFPEENGNTLIYSAKDPASLDKLVQMITARVFSDSAVHTYLIPFDKGQLVDFINRETGVINTEYVETGTKVKTTVNPIQAGKLRQYLVEED